MKISSSIDIITTSSLLIICFRLFASQSVELVSIQAFNETPYSKSQNYPENNNLPLTTQNNNSRTSIFSNPFYLSNDTLVLGKIPIEKSNTINREVQFFFERGIINISLVTYNMGYYMEGSSINGYRPDFNPLSIDLNTKSGPNYAKGFGIFLTENGCIIEWDALDQTINKSDDRILYLGMIFFSPDADYNDELSFLKNRMGLYEFSINLDDTTISHPCITPSSSDATTNRTIWFWPRTH